MPLPSLLDGNYSKIPLLLGYDPTTGQAYAAQAGSTGTDTFGNPYAALMQQRSRTNKAVAAGVGTAAVVVKAAPGELVTIVVTATGTAAVSIYDNAAAATGTVLMVIPANAATGAIYNLNMGANNGITVGQVNNSPALTISYI